MHTFPTLVAAVALLVSSCCSQSTRPAESPSAEPEPAATSTEVTTPAEPSPAPSPTDGAVDVAETVVARILESGPTGDGNCVQRSYRVERTDVQGVDPFWIHFEHCQGSPSPSFDGSGLTVGDTHRFRLRRGASENFGDDPMIVGVEAP